MIVENLNIVKRHTKPRPMKDANRMGGTDDPARRRDRQAGADRRSRTSCSSAPSATGRRASAMAFKEIKGEQVKVRVCKRADCDQEIDGGDHR